MSELIDRGFRTESARETIPSEGFGAPLRTLGFAALSVVAHVGLSLVMPSEAHTLANVPPREAQQSFFEIVQPQPIAAPPAPPAPVDEPEPEVRPERLRERARVAVVRAIPSSEPPSPEPDATPAASTVVSDAEPAVQGATIVSTEGGLATNLTAGVGNGGAVRGTRHAGPIGMPVTAVTVEERRADIAALLSAYRSLVTSELRPHLRQPRMLGRENETRVVKLGITIDASGRVLSVRVRESSGTDHLDMLALDSVRSIRSVSAPPSELPWQRPRELTFPIAYR